MPPPLHSDPAPHLPLLWMAGGIGLVTLLAALVISTMMPPDRLREERDEQRRRDLIVLLEAVSRLGTDRGESALSFLPSDAPREICRQELTQAQCREEGGVDLSAVLGAYLSAIPRDPLAVKTGTGTLYTIIRSQTGQITVSALNAETAFDLSVYR